MPGTVGRGITLDGLVSSSMDVDGGGGKGGVEGGGRGANRALRGVTLGPGEI